MKTPNSMKNINAAIATLCLLTAVFISANCAVAQETSPKIHFETPIHDFNEVKSGDLIRHDFTLKNTGTAPLEILEVRPSCGCTTAGDWPKLLKPGESGIIPIQLKTDNFRGQITKTVRVKSNDPKNPQSVLQIKGKVWTPIQITPDYASFQRLKGPDVSATKEIKITNFTDDPLMLTNIKSSNPKFKPILETLRHGKDFVLRIKTVPPLQYGLNRAYITMKTSNPDMPSISITAHANVSKPIETTPTYLTMPVGKLDRDLKKYITVINNSGKPLMLSDYGLGIDGVKIDLQELKKDKYYRFTIVFPKDFEVKDNISGSFKMTTNHPEFSKIEVPLKPYKRPTPVTR
jgi:hypothetical protein